MGTGAALGQGLKSGSRPAFWARAWWEGGPDGRVRGGGGWSGGVLGGWPGGEWGWLAGSGRVGPEGGMGWLAGRGWAGWSAGGQGGRGVVRTFTQPERVIVVWQSKERAPKQGRIGNMEKSCSG